MKEINVVDKTERLELGNVVELRGNFVEVFKDGEVSYNCFMFRTKNNNATFEELYNKERLNDAHKYLSSTDWIYAKCLEENIDVSIKYSDIIEKRKAMRALINELDKCQRI